MKLPAGQALPLIHGKPELCKALPPNQGNVFKLHLGKRLKWA